MDQPAPSVRFPDPACAVRGLSICDTLAEQELLEVNKITTVVALAKGASVFFEGDDNTYLYNVVSGAVSLSKLLHDGRRQVIGLIFPGDFLGLSVANAHAYTAEALTDTTLCQFNRARLTSLTDRFPELKHRFLELASKELAEAHAQILMLGQKDATERVSTTLVYLMNRIGQKRGDETVIDMPMKRVDLADYAGIAIETLSRCLSQLSKDGIISLPQPWSIHVLKVAELELLAGN